MAEEEEEEEKEEIWQLGQPHRRAELHPRNVPPSRANVRCWRSALWGCMVPWSGEEAAYCPPASPHTHVCPRFVTSVYNYSSA